MKKLEEKDLDIKVIMDGTPILLMIIRYIPTGQSVSAKGRSQHKLKKELLEMLRKIL